MNADGTLTDAEIAQAFGDSFQGRKFEHVEGLDPNTELHVGDGLRVIAYHDTTFVDGLFETPQQDAEQYTDRVVNVLKDQGIVVVPLNVQGIAAADVTDATRECFVYDFEIQGFVDPTNPALQSQQASLGWTLAAAGVLVGALAARVVSIKIASIKPEALVEALNKATSAASDVAFWLGLAAIAVSIAYIIGKTKGATSGSAS